MKQSPPVNHDRRQFLQTIAAAAGMAMGNLPLAMRAAAAEGGMKIGVIGSGRVGGTVGALWVKAGYEVMFSARNLDEVKKLADSLGPKASAGTPEQAAAFGEVLFFSVPYAALPQLGKDLAGQIKGKVVLDSCNPITPRDGEMAKAAQAKGAGIASAEYLPGARIVRAFNSVGYNSLRSEAHRAGEKIAIPLAGDDEAALKIAAKLVKDAGFEPVIVGPLARGKEFDVGTAVFGKALAAREPRRSLCLGS
jgi:8-hydroxy-5-deazaflavin:NADPH oxidoreductase